jgi:mannitol/fructose-specific phosphotransferase system IIA component (Ntr-type)
MRLSDILKVSAVRVAAESRDKRAVIRELVGLAASAAGPDITDAEAVVKAVLEREATKTTGIGSGLATPHAKTPAVRRLVMALAVPKTPIDFDSLDGRPVSVLILLLAPPDQTGPYIQALARVSKLMSLEPLRRKIVAAPSAAEVLRLLTEEEAHLLKC